uniref:Uncharacterized protein n=1 Tax=Aegilops tauschii subsp. strangulata TaxID=200361 RepID=A0A453AV67_AEGTS
MPSSLHYQRVGSSTESRSNRTKQPFSLPSSLCFSESNRSQNTRRNQSRFFTPASDQTQAIDPLCYYYVPCHADTAKSRAAAGRRARHGHGDGEREEAGEAAQRRPRRALER